MLTTFLLLLFLSNLYANTDNSPLPGFDKIGSDPQAIALADQTMERLGGRSNWDATRYITWRFFGKRLHVWDKWTGNIRFEDTNNTVLMNIHTQQGRAWHNTTEQTNPDTLAQMLEKAYHAWINDSYWLVMPYKLKDSGVTLKYLTPGYTEAGRLADILELTFKEVGLTPENKYHVYIDREDKLVTQWDFFPTADTPEPRFKTPWTNWQAYGNIWLADGRGQRSHTAVATFDTLAESVFTDPSPINLTIIPDEE